MLRDFGCNRFVYCSDAGLASESNRVLNHVQDRSFIVTQSIKKLPKEEREWALNRSGFRRISDNRPVDLDRLQDDDMDQLFYKEIPYFTKHLDQRIIVTYSPKYAAYQKTIREKQVERAKCMVKACSVKRERRNPNDPARFITKIAATKEGEVAKIHYSLDEEKVKEEAKYDGLYAVCTDILDDDPSEILKVSEGRWQIETCFRIMKTEFLARPVHVRRDDRIKAHFLVCFLALLVYRLLERELGKKYTCEQILETLKEMKFASVGGQGYMPLYERTELTDALHETGNFRTDLEFITKQKMREIQKKSKRR